MSSTSAKFCPITGPIITKIGPTDPSTRIVRSHDPSNHQTKAGLSHCRCWADCITVTLVKPPEATVSPHEGRPLGVAVTPNRLQDDLRPVTRWQAGRLSGRGPLFITPMNLQSLGVVQIARRDGVFATHRLSLSTGLLALVDETRYSIQCSFGPTPAGLFQFTVGILRMLYMKMQ